MHFINRAQAKKDTGLSYLGGVNTSAKMIKSGKKGVDTYIIYLAPAESSGYNVCPMATKDCIAACLNESGHNRIDTKKNMINKARIAKTKLYFEHREYFVQWMLSEIQSFKDAAKKKGHEFSVRFNGTSDINLETLKIGNKNILQILPDVQFYDYTKVYNRVKLLDKYTNYDLTYSFSGKNWLECEAALANGMRVAVVFEKELPAFYKGIEVINGDESDIRYLDAKDCIVGLKQKMVRKKIDITKQKFIIPYGHKDCAY